MSGAIRKLKKSIKESLPVIIFVPSDTFVPDDADVITVTDEKIYSAVRRGVEDALEKGRSGVRKEPKSASRIII